ncbi:MAG: hypothetical protein ACREOG_11965, partial [Gemmatimonadaceae bacterium]
MRNSDSAYKRGELPDKGGDGSVSFTALRPCSSWFRPRKSALSLWIIALTVLVLGPLGGLTAQRYRLRIEPNVAYDGRFTFARIRYTEYRSIGWSYD